MKINYKVIGEGMPVVMLHGWSLDHQVMFHCMEPLFEKLDGWKRIYIDLPGMGESESPESIKNSDDILACMIDFVDQLIPDEPFIICGQSYGGYLARGIARFRKERVKGLLLLCPMVIPNFEDRRVPEHQTLIKDNALLSRLSAEERTEFEPMAVVQGEQEWKRFRDEILLPSQKTDYRFLQKVRENNYGFSFNLNKDIPIFDYPALIITGRQDSSTGYTDAIGLMEGFPRGTFAVVDMAGHNLQIERPEIFEALVSDWLQRINVNLEN